MTGFARMRRVHYTLPDGTRGTISALCREGFGCSARGRRIGRRRAAPDNNRVTVPASMAAAFSIASACRGFRIARVNAWSMSLDSVTLRRGCGKERLPPESGLDRLVIEAPVRSGRRRGPA